MLRRVVGRILPGPVKRIVKRFMGPLLTSPTPTLAAQTGVDASMQFDPRRMEVLRAELFPQTRVRPWLDEPDAESQIQRKLKTGDITTEEAALCRKFAQTGYAIAERLIDPVFADRVWNAYIMAANAGKLPGVTPLRTGEFSTAWARVCNAHQWVPEIGEVLNHERLVRLVSVLLGRECVPFQTIPSLFGSEQLPHSDAIHMTTHPLGFLVAAWVALEDIHPDSGPLVLYPGSHKLPYYLSQEVGIGPHEFKTKGRDVYVSNYEPFVDGVIRTKNLAPAYFAPARKGDVLIWHHNLLHGGSKVNNTSLTRKSVVCHYFAKGVVCYHDLSGDPAGV